ncbi:MAG TPA: MobV family relaxase, partial [Pyrinomonadaceae bacterium]|nr:MobV family relaxase [Pyrinomonadaceae bacterium]
LHNGRLRETPNADPERERENRMILGHDRPTPEMVKEVIEAHGGKPRSDSVEAVEVLLTASPEWWRDDDDLIDKKKVSQFSERAREFLSDRRNGGICVKAILHMDEHTPHVHAHVVPIDPDGKLNCKHYFGGRDKLRQWQDRFAEKVKDLGLERGVEGSRARHTDVKEFYAAIERDHRIKIDYQKLPDPPKMCVTKEAAQKYKEEFAKALIEQVKEPIRTELHQAMLARDANAKLKETKKRLAERTQDLSQEKIISHDLRNELERLRGQYQDILPRVEKAESRIKDVSHDAVLRMSGYSPEHINARGQVDYVKPELNQMVRLSPGGLVQDAGGKVIAQDTVTLVREIMKREGKPSSREDAVGWLADKCGKEQAIAASLYEQERSSAEFLHDRDMKRARATRKPSRDEQLTRPQPEHVREQVQDREGPIRERGFSR